jgi:hypothetical protein
MQKILLKFGIPQKIVNLVQETYRDYSCQVVHNGQKSNPIKIYTGVRQGCTLSPTIFIIVMNIIMRNTVGKAKRGLQWNMYDRLEDLEFADDIRLLAHKYKDIQAKLTQLHEELQKVGLSISINISKTKEI